MKGVERVVYWTLAAAVCVALALHVERLLGAELTPEHAYRIYAVAYGQMGGPPAWRDKANMPTIHPVSSDEICALVKDSPGCGAQGAYTNGEAKVYIDKSLDFDTLYATTVLLHEFVHHFQYLKRGMPGPCVEVAMRERQAYLIQADMLERGGRDLEAYRVVKSGLVRVHCQVEQAKAP